MSAERIAAMVVTSLSPSVFTVANLLSAAECGQLMRLAEDNGFTPADVRTDEGQKSMPRVRNNERTMVESPAWVALLWERLWQAGMPRFDSAQAVGLPKDLRFYKYRPGQRFKMHKDGPWREGGLTSRLTLLVYLNDDFAGGATDFREFQVVPKTGMGLLFIHDSWHEGATVTEGAKYVLRSDVLYSQDALAEA